MAQNFLYMFEFVVDDLLITRPNNCAPEEYPTCCEISFRSSVFVSICDREFGKCVDIQAPKCGKCCLFSLESPVTDKDRLLIHIYKKKTDKCKFLVGATDLPIKPLFDKVTENFNIENPNWMEKLKKHNESMPNPKSPSKTTIVDNDCDEETQGRREQLCPTSELTKRLLPLFNMKGMQTGNLVLIMRLVCNGPTIVSSFPFSKMCAPCGMKKPPPSSICPHPQEPKPCPCPCPPYLQMPDPCEKEEKKVPVCRRYFACNADKRCPCDVCEDDCGRGCEKEPKSSTRQKIPAPNCCPSVDPCKKDPGKKTPVCRRYFADNGCACEDDCATECPTSCKKNKKKPKCCSPQRPPSPSSNRGQPERKPDKNTCQRCFNNNEAEEKNSCACEECVDECEAATDECSEEESSQSSIHPCFVTPSKPEPGPEAYEEFEACLNGSGLVIRVLKDTHQVQNIQDGTENQMDDSGSECDKCQRQPPQNSQCESMTDVLQRCNFARNYIKRRTGGKIINHPRLPKIRANIKYSGNDSCCADNYRVPFSKIKQYCDNQENKLDLYRKKQSCDSCDCGPLTLPKHPENNRSCCLQVDPCDLKNTLKGINVDTRKKGIEVCYKTCDDTDSDVFLVKLGSKQRCRKKKNEIEIELKTPKQPLTLPIQKVTTETQINEVELDAALLNIYKRKVKKGKKKKTCQ